MKILIYSGDQEINSWLKETFTKQELTFIKTANELEKEYGNKDLIIVDYQSDLETSVWDVCEAGFKGKIALLANSNIQKTQKLAKAVNHTYNNVEAFKLSSLKGHSAKKVAKLIGVEYSEIISKEAAIDKGLKKNIDRQIKEFQSIYEILFDNFPGFLMNNNGKATDVHADTLYSIWKDKKNKLAENVYRKPIEVKSEDIASMQQEGLVQMNHDKIEITAKGQEVLNVMILGDERSIFNHDGTNPSYRTALANTDVGKRIKNSRKN